jgi:hypothetical protein
VLAGASAYTDPTGGIYDIQHLLVMRDDAEPEGLMDRIESFRGGVAVVPTPPRVRAISSTSVRAALDRREDLEALCPPLVARTLLERRLYVHYPAQKQPVAVPDRRLLVSDGAEGVPASLLPVVERAHPGAKAKAKGLSMFVLASGDNQRRPLAAVTWRKVSAAALPATADWLATAHSCRRSPAFRVTRPSNGSFPRRSRAGSTLACSSAWSPCLPVAPVAWRRRSGGSAPRCRPGND